MPSLSAYAGWNTSGNTLGTVIAHAIIDSYAKKHFPERQHYSRAFLFYRWLEDWGYQALIRQDLTAHVLPEKPATYFDVSQIQPEIESLIYEKLTHFTEQYLPVSFRNEFTLFNVYMPWRRMFEVGLSLSFDGQPIWKTASST
ncbi:DUF4127 family protein [Bacillaceae bacterium SIJ1]|nr:DUF4127 family protein [Litoribacterium kuwaitense]NGP46365.1 DUF4127 family protein [Litoribacterium kuwaitense]